MFKNLIEVRFTHNQAVIVMQPDAIGTQFKLPGTLLSGDIKCAQSTQLQDCLQDKCRLSNPRFATQQHHRCRNKSPTQNPVQLAIKEVDAWFLVGTNLPQLLRLTPYALEGTCVLLFSRDILAYQLFHESGPLTARGTF